VGKRAFPLYPRGQKSPRAFAHAVMAVQAILPTLRFNP